MSRVDRYGYAHRVERRRWVAVLAETPLPCSRCGKPVTALMRWDLDHTDDRAGYRGVAHATCNRRAGGVKSATRFGLAPPPRLKSSDSW